MWEGGGPWLGNLAPLFGLTQPLQSCHLSTLLTERADGQCQAVREGRQKKIKIITALMDQLCSRGDSKGKGILKKALDNRPGPDSVCQSNQTSSLTPGPRSSSPHCTAPCHSLDESHSLSKASGHAPVKSCSHKQQGESSSEQQTVASCWQTPCLRLPTVWKVDEEMPRTGPA